MILVTGGTGLVGAHLLYQLTKRNEKIRAIYRNKQKVEALKSILFFDENEALFHKIEWVEADITNIPSLIEAFNDISYVYHCAGFISFDPKKFKKLKSINIEGTAHIVNLCIKNKIKKLCYVSSIAAIGKDSSTPIITEETEWNSEIENDVYAITKHGAEMEVWRGSQEGLNSIIINPGIILAAGFWKSASGSIFTKVKNKLPFYPQGKTGFVDVLDVVEIMIKLMDSNYTNQRYIVISENVSYKKLLYSIAESLNVSPPKLELKPWLLKIFWRLDWLKNTLFKTERILTRITAKNRSLNHDYSNKKIKKDLNFTFIPIKESITDISKELKDFSSLN